MAIYSLIETPSSLGFQNRICSPGIPSSSQSKSPCWFLLVSPSVNVGCSRIQCLFSVYFTPLLISSSLMALNTLNSTSMHPTAAWLTCTFGCFKNMSNFCSFPVFIFHSWSSPSQFMEASFFHLLRTKIPGVICDFFISLTFTFSPSANPVYSISKIIHRSTASLHPPTAPC